MSPMKRKRRSEDVYDFDLKVALSNADVLAQIVQASVEEYRDMSREAIKKCMDLDETGIHARTAGTERLAAGGGSFRFDAVFMLRHPDSGKERPLHITVALEGQGKRNLAYPLKNR